MLKEQKQSEGPFFLGERMSLAEANCMPFVGRLPMLKHYKGFEIPPDKFMCLHKWMQAMKKRESFQKTTQPDSYYIEAYKTIINPTTR